MFYKSRQIAVYSGDKSNINFAAGKSGVYIIYINGQLRYVGYSTTQLEKTILRHFQSWNDKTQIRVSYGPISRRNATVRVTLCSPERAKKLESALIIKHKPIDNPDKLRRLITTDEKNTLDS